MVERFVERHLAEATALASSSFDILERPSIPSFAARFCSSSFVSSDLPLPLPIRFAAPAALRLLEAAAQRLHQVGRLLFLGLAHAVDLLALPLRA